MREYFTHTQKYTFSLNKIEKRDLFIFVATHRETKQLIGFILAGFLIFIPFLFLIFLYYPRSGTWNYCQSNEWESFFKNNWNDSDFLK